MLENRRDSEGGWWARLLRPLMEKLQRRRLKKLAAAYDRALAVWTGEENRLRELLETARTFRGYTGSDLVNRGYEVPIVVKRNERIVYLERAAFLVETKRERGKYVGGYAGFSFRVVKSVRYHAGRKRGTYKHRGCKLILTSPTFAFLTAKASAADDGSKRARGAIFPYFKTGEASKGAWRVRFPSASA